MTTCIFSNGRFYTDTICTTSILRKKVILNTDNQLKLEPEEKIQKYNRVRKIFETPDSIICVSGSITGSYEFLNWRVQIVKDFTEKNFSYQPTDYFDGLEYNKITGDLLHWYVGKYHMNGFVRFNKLIEKYHMRSPFYTRGYVFDELDKTKNHGVGSGCHYALEILDRGGTISEAMTAAHINDPYTGKDFESIKLYD